MAVGVWNFELTQGARYENSIQWKIGGAPVLMTGWTAKMFLKTSAESDKVVAAFTTSDGSIELGDSDGYIHWHKTAHQTKLIPAGEYVYDLKLYPTPTTPIVKLRGKFTVHAEITK